MGEKAASLDNLAAVEEIGHHSQAWRRFGPMKRLDLEVVEGRIEKRWQVCVLPTHCSINLVAFGVVVFPFCCLFSLVRHYSDECHERILVFHERQQIFRACMSGHPPILASAGRLVGY